jgi:hypothetical protein
VREIDSSYLSNSRNHGSSDQVHGCPVEFWWTGSMALILL